MTLKSYVTPSLGNSMSKVPRISIIVCYHTDDFLPGFLASVYKSSHVDYEIIEMGGPGLPAEKRNKGAKKAKGEYLAFFDDDVEIFPGCLYEFQQYLDSNPNVGMVYGKLWNAERTDRFDEAGGYLTATGFIWSRAGQNDLDMGQYDRAEAILAGKSASCMIRKSTFNAVGGFDEEFGILGEETDLSWRVWLHGQEVHYVPTAKGYHWFNTTRKDKGRHYTPSRIYFNGCRNYITMLIKNLETRNLWRIVPIHVVIWLGAGLAMLITLKVRQGVQILKGLLYVLGQRDLILSKRKRVQQQRKVSDEHIWPSIHHQAPRGYYKQRILRYITLGLHG